MARKPMIRDILGFIWDTIERMFHPDRLQLTAYHEAGHAVAAVALGIGFKYLWVVGDRHTLGGIVLDQKCPHHRPEFNPRDPEDRRAAEGWILLALAGESADVHHGGRDPDFERHGAMVDFRAAATLAERLFACPGECEAFFREMRAGRTASSASRVRWRQISAVATQLGRLRTLDQRQVGRIMDEIAAAGEPGGPEKGWPVSSNGSDKLVFND